MNDIACLLQRLRRLGLWAVALWFGVSGPAQALTPLIADGELRGISGLEIAGRRYEVRFADGSFNTLYPEGFSGYGPLARAAAESLRAAGNALTGAPPEGRLRLAGCRSAHSCTLLIPERAERTAPQARLIHAVEAIYAGDRVRSVPAALWPFDAATDTHSMPDLLYAILTPTGESE